MRGDVLEARSEQQRIDLAADQRVATGLALERDLALDRLAGGGAVGMEVRRPVIALDHRDRAARLEQALERGKRLDGLGEVLEHEADEDMVERTRRERQREDVSLRGLHVRVPGGAHAPLGLGRRLGGEVDGDEVRVRAALCQRHGLRPDAATGFEDARAGGVGRVAVQEFHKRPGLIVQPFALSRVIPVDVGPTHDLSLYQMIATWGSPSLRTIDER
jgi:hypothetical protein